MKLTFSRFFFFWAVLLRIFVASVAESVFGIETIDKLEQKMLILLLTFSAGILAPVLAQVCPEPYGVQTYPHETFCDKFHLVRNIFGGSGTPLNGIDCF